MKKMKKMPKMMNHEMKEGKKKEMMEEKLYKAAMKKKGKK